MVEGLACFRIGIRHKGKSTVVPAAVDFLFFGVLVVTYPPDPSSRWGLMKGRGDIFGEGLHPSSTPRLIFDVAAVVSIYPFSYLTLILTAQILISLKIPMPL